MANNCVNSFNKNNVLKSQFMRIIFFYLKSKTLFILNQ